MPKIESVNAALPKIEHFVERERGLRFKRPVRSELLGHKAFVAKLDQGNKPPKPRAVEKTTSVLAALGLINPHVDLYSALRKAYNGGTLGFYDPKTKRLYVLGHKATPGVRAVLSHELTHALTDEWFGINRPKLNHNKQEKADAFTDLIEGDAERTRIAYEARVLSPAEQAIAKREENGGATPKVPKVLLDLIGLPYVLGPRFVHALYQAGGIKEINKAYRHPPVSSEQILVPQKYLDGVEPKHIPVPKSDAPRLTYGDLGVIVLLLALENGVPRSSAPYGLTSWAGDQFSVWRAGHDRWCLRDTVEVDGSASGEFQDALKTWVASRHGAATIERSGEATTFRSCSS